MGKVGLMGMWLLDPKHRKPKKKKKYPNEHSKRKTRGGIGCTERVSISRSSLEAWIYIFAELMHSILTDNQTLVFMHLFTFIRNLKVAWNIFFSQSYLYNCTFTQFGGFTTKHNFHRYFITIIIKLVWKSQKKAW